MRKSMTLTVLAATVLLTTGVQAAERLADAHQAQHVHMLGKRPYQAVMVASAGAEQAWTGATLRVDQPVTPSVHKLHQLAKRAY